MIEHKEKSGHRKPCTCGGYHYPHRPGSPCCETNKHPTYHRALREGSSDEDIIDAFIDDALFGVAGSLKETT
jgi:hypothetical protein